MKVYNWKNRKRITISAGEFYVTNEDVLITTLLGSCVSACLYDPYNRISGMNHFMLSSRRYSRDMPLSITEAGRYGVNSMELLINEMLKWGAERSRLKAKAFGGASVLKTINLSASNYFAVGDVNVRFIREFLQNEQIPLVSHDLGGMAGRVIYFDTGNFSAYVRKMAKTGGRLVKSEEQHWKKSIQTQEETETQVDLW
jgi:chemotaxis protein CheD